MEKGLAIPHYVKLIEVASKDLIKNKVILSRAYQYLGAYEANITKDYRHHYRIIKYTGAIS